MCKLAWRSGVAAFLGLLGGCAGGQTGHGHGDGDCDLREREQVSYEESAELGFDVRPHLPELAIGPEGIEHELLLIAPPELWTERGMTAPVDRTAEASLRIWANGRFWFFSADGDISACGHSGFFMVDIELTIPSLDLTLSGTGRAEQLHSANGNLEELPRNTAEVDIAELGSCFWNDDEELTCGSAVYGSSACLDQSTWQDEPDVPQAELGLHELLERVVAELPAELSCAGGRSPLPIDLQIAVPERACMLDPERFPITATLASGDSEVERAGGAWLEPEVECFIGQFDCSGSQCDWVPRDTTDREPNPDDTPQACDRLSVSFAATSDRSVALTVYVDAAGEVNADVVVSEEPAEDFLNCAGTATFRL